MADIPAEGYVNKARTEAAMEMRRIAAEFMREQAREAWDLAATIRAEDRNSKLAAKMDLRADEFSFLADQIDNLWFAK